MPTWLGVDASKLIGLLALDDCQAIGDKSPSHLPRACSRPLSIDRANQEQCDVAKFVSPYAGASSARRFGVYGRLASANATLKSPIIEERVLRP
jgi:hypothetical protein